MRLEQLPLSLLVTVDRDSYKWMRKPEESQQGLEWERGNLQNQTHGSTYKLVGEDQEHIIPRVSELMQLGCQSRLEVSTHDHRNFYMSVISMYSVIIYFLYL